MGKLNWGKSAVFFLLCATTAIALPAQTLTTLHSFDSTDGAYPWAALVQATDGNLYGTTQEGGANGYGTVFKITPSGTLTTLHSFDITDGASPQAGLVQATDGNFYGTTLGGGANGVGTVFKITPSGTLTTLYSFCSESGCTDGYGLVAGLVQATDGNFYGTTQVGGQLARCRDWLWDSLQNHPKRHADDASQLLLRKRLHGRRRALRRAGPGHRWELLRNNGDLRGNGVGTVFKITPSGTLTTLYSFCPQSGCADGAEPNAALVQATDGNFYGTAFEGGANGVGTVFKITPSGTLTTLHSFDNMDGAFPQAGLVQAADGNFYGTMRLDGDTSTHGTVFKITPGGTLTTLYRFCAQSGGCPDGSQPYAGLVQDTNGKFYGTTYYGGTNNVGTVFSLAVGLGPPTNKGQCKNDGWKAFTIPRKFKNQGDCVSFVNTGK